jgi:hypothetical protein
MTIASQFEQIIIDQVNVRSTIEGISMVEICRLALALDQQYYTIRDRDDQGDTLITFMIHDDESSSVQIELITFMFHDGSFSVQIDLTADMGEVLCES